MNDSRDNFDSKIVKSLNNIDQIFNKCMENTTNIIDSSEITLNKKDPKHATFQFFFFFYFIGFILS